MKRWIGRMIACAMCFQLTVAIVARAAEGDDDEEIARKEKELRELKDKKAKEAAEAKKAEEDAAAAAAATKKTPGKITAPPGVPHGEVPDTSCKVCMGLGIVPNLPYKAYYKVIGETPPSPDYQPPWKTCAACQKNTDSKWITEDMKFRQKAAQERHAQFEEKAGKKMALILTPYVAIHSTLPPGTNRTIAMKLEKLMDILQTNSKSMVLSNTRPDSDDIVLLNDDKSFLTYLDHTFDEKLQGDQKALMKKGTGWGHFHFSLAKTNVPNATPDSQASQAVYNMGGLLIKSATDDKAKAWLVEGFQCYCENATLGTNNNYSFVYEPNTKVKFGKNWNADIKTYAVKGQLKPWDQIFSFNLEGMKALDYLSCYSVVSCLIKSDARLFDKMVQFIREGDDSATAIEKAYGLKIADMQNKWAAWAATQK